MTNETINTEVATVEKNEPSQLITLKPEKYVAEVFKPFNTSLKKAVREWGKVEYDIQTTAGMEVAKKARAAFRTIRTSAENERKARKAPITAIGKLLDSTYKELESEIAPFEDKHDAAIKAEEQRKEDEKQRKLAEERVRIEAIENRIQQIRNVPLQFADKSSDEVRVEIERQSSLVLDPADFSEYLEDAINAVNATLVELEKVRLRAVDREDAERRVQEERAELARLRAEREQREKEEAERREAERRQRDAEERERRAAAEKAEEEARAKDEEIARLQAMLAAHNKPADPEPAAEPQTVDAKELVGIIGTYYDHATIKVNGDPVLRNADGSRSVFCDIDEGEDESPAGPPTLRLGQICERLGFVVTADFLTSIGFPPAATDKSAKLYHDADFPRICQAIARHAVSVGERFTAREAA